LRIIVGNAGIVEVNDGKETATLELDVPMLCRRDVYHASGTRNSAGELIASPVRAEPGPGPSILSDGGQSYRQVWRDVLTGSRDGTNLVFTLASAPTPPESILVFRNGLVMSLGDDMVITGSTVTFLAGNAPTSGSILWARYQTL
jgi:hypothetical protein